MAFSFPSRSATASQSGRWFLPCRAPVVGKPVRNRKHPMPRISPEYLLADGSPRYGIRTAEPAEAAEADTQAEAPAPETQRGGDAAADACSPRWPRSSLNSRLPGRGSSWQNSLTFRKRSRR
jgi:hypothetical protein